jgi:endonuclease-8
VSREEIERLVDIAQKFLRANVAEAAPGGIATYAGLRRTTGRRDPGARFWVYGRGGKPCRRCGTPVSRAKQGPNVRSTYWCERCQPR